MPDIRKPQADFHFSISQVLPLLVLFIVLRFIVLLSFPPFNDEAIHAQEAQLIHQDRDTYKSISVNNVYGQWRPPLIFWLAAVPVGLISNPLLAVRVVT